MSLIQWNMIIECTSKSKPFIHSFIHSNNRKEQSFQKKRMDKLMVLFFWGFFLFLTRIIVENFLNIHWRSFSSNGSIGSQGMSNFRRTKWNASLISIWTWIIWECAYPWEHPTLIGVWFLSLQLHLSHEEQRLCFRES